MEKIKNWTVYFFSLDAIEDKIAVKLKKHFFFEHKTGRRRFLHAYGQTISSEYTRGEVLLTISDLCIRVNTGCRLIFCLLPSGKLNKI